MREERKERGQREEKDWDIWCLPFRTSQRKPAVNQIPLMCAHTHTDLRARTHMYTAAVTDMFKCMHAHICTHTSITQPSSIIVNS